MTLKLRLGQNQKSHLEALNKGALAHPRMAKELELDLVDRDDGGYQLLDVLLRATFADWLIMLNFLDFYLSTFSVLSVFFFRISSPFKPKS